MLRLTRTTRLPHEVILLLEGQIVAEWVELLEAECLTLLRSDQNVLLDLSRVSYLDRRAARLLAAGERDIALELGEAQIAARLLRDLAARSVQLINCPPLVADLVTEDAP